MESTSSEFARLVSGFVESHEAVWRGIEPAKFSLGARVSGQQKEVGAQLSSRLLADLEDHLMRYPRSKDRQSRWRKAAFDQLRRYTESCLRYSPDEHELLFDPQFQQVTCDFVEQARAFDSTIEVDDLFQALRNVWIMNSIQLLLGQQVRLTRSVFAYSMLYPCTDNFLDDVEHTAFEKHELNAWLERRINGGAADHRYPRLDLLFRLIELEHARPESPHVYDSIMAIQQAQRQSMIQHGGKDGAENNRSIWKHMLLGEHVRSIATFDRHSSIGPKLAEGDILRLSIAKGGTSVMAHGYLVNRCVSVDQAEFLFGFGVFLQLLDDLQDLRADMNAKHVTLFSLAAMNNQCIDEIILRLLRFMDVVLGRINRFSDHNAPWLRQVIWRNCVLLLLTAVAHQEDFCSRELVEHLERFSPLHFRSVRELNVMLRQRYERVRQRLVGGGRVRSVWNVLGPSSGDLWSLPSVVPFTCLTAEQRFQR